MWLIEYSSSGWQDWDVERHPLLREGMPVLVDDDLRFDDGGVPRPAMVVNAWLRGLPVSGAPSPRTWRIYAEAARVWLEFLVERGVGPFESRERLRAALSAYAEHRLAGPAQARWEVSTWNLHVGVLAAFYEWAVAERHAAAVPFSYVLAKRCGDGVLREYRRNLAKLRAPKPHVTVRYLDRGFAELFVNGLAGLIRDGTADESFRGRELGRNAAMGALALSTGLRRQEFTHLLVYEVPPLPPRRSPVPVLLPVAPLVAKGGKRRTTWVGYDALARVHEYIALERAVAARDSQWRPATDPLVVEDPDWAGARINGSRRGWDTLTRAERLRLVAPGGGSCLLALRSGGAPFTDWATVFRRTSDRIRRRFEPRFPLVYPHMLRHSFAVSTLELLVSGYYQQAADLVANAGADAGLALYLTKADPLMVLRDLLGHSSATTTEVYVKRLDVTRIYRDAYIDAGRRAGLVTAQVQAEVDAEFDEGYPFDPPGSGPAGVG